MAMSMNANGQENGDGYMCVDHTFHTPSFGDEEFDIPPINLPPTTPSSDTNSSDVYGSTQPLSHQEQPTQQQQQQQQQQQNMSNNHQQHQQTQQHIMSPPPQMSPSPCSPSYSTLERLGPVMTSVTTTSSPPTMMTSFSNSPQHHQQQQHHQVSHMQNMAQQHHSQQHQYGNPHQGDMYMVQIAPGSMMPPQSVQFHVQPYAIPTSYANGPSMQQQQHQHQQHMHLEQQQHHHHGVPHPHHGAMHHSQHHPHGHPQQLLPPSPLLQLQLGAGPRMRPGSVGSSPPGSTHTSPGLETSEDSDDSGHLNQVLCTMKRPSPEPVERPSSVGKPIKKPKVQKKKKKRDPNEPQKPVSAYALFFRDTQAAIKGQNPNASFGEVSKIVASMWDGLDLDHKNVYKKKTEAAKKEYLKALAAYRASLVTKAANDQSDNIYGGGGPNGSTPTSMSSPMAPMPGQTLSPLQKKSPLLTSLMEGTPVSSLQNMTNSQSLIMGQSQMNGGHHPHMIPQHLPQHSSSAPSHQLLHQMLSPQQQQQQQMMHMGSPPPPHVMQQHNMQMAALNGGSQNNNNNTIPYTSNMSPQLSHQGQQQQQQQGMMCTSPLQNSCPGGEAPQQEWDRDYCNNDCVVSHCRDVFTTWVASRPPQNSYASVK
ncbi:TOX high mobility group box family member 4-A-like [Uloborus diversus]|uniref:TOX high mobility group box family member 4-A-like n=1 Tax=Uloborus diversus TaxID=327109 RepID=UPI002409A9D4|nr:TOX high mobility group box family member 4-A-like [Uloborus diversus]